MIWSAISGISSSKRRRTKSGWVRLRMILTRWPTLRTSRMTARSRSLGWWLSPGICSLRGKQRVGLAEVDGDGAPLEPLDGPGDEVAALVFELVEEAVALGLADLLDDDLLGRLGGDPAQQLGVHLLAVLDRLDLAGLGVDRDVDLVGVGVVLLGRRLQRRLDPLEQNILGDILVAVDAIDDADQIDAHASPPRRAGSVRESDEWSGPGTRPEDRAPEEAWFRFRATTRRDRLRLPGPRADRPRCDPPARDRAPSDGRGTAPRTVANV